MISPASSIHWYYCTACLHELHDRCSQACKFCDRPCQCECHETSARGRPADTSRDVDQEIS